MVVQYAYWVSVRFLLFLVVYIHISVCFSEPGRLFMKVSADLRERFHAAQTPEGPRTIRVNIKAETLVYHSEKKNTGDVNADFAAITSDVTDTKPAFYLFNRAAGTADTKSWGLVAFVPEMAPVSG